MTRLMSEASVESDHTLGTKTCTKCGEAKPRSEFSKQKAGKDGLQSRCKLCAAAEKAVWRAENPEKERAHAKAWRAENPEKVRAKIAAWAKANPEKRCAYSTTYRKENPEKARAAVAAWAKANPDRVAAMGAAWRKANPEKRRAYVHNYQARKQANGGTISPNIVEIKMREQKGLCPCCGMPLTEYHLDHIMPLSRGGPNTDENVQLLLPHCNLSKGTKTMDEYRQYLYKKAA